MNIRRLFALIAVLLLAGCAGEDSGGTARPVYSANQAGQIISHDAGMVMAVEEVVIQGNSNYPGAPGMGSQVGKAVGQGVLSGNPLYVVGAIGGIMGGKAGANLDNQVGDKITIALDSGKTITIVQARDQKQPIMPGERVMIESGSTTQVVREPATKDPEYTAVKASPKW